MTDSKSMEEIERAGIEAVENGAVKNGLDLLEKIPPEERSLSVVTCLAWCRAERGLLEEAKVICSEALELEPSNAIHYLNLGRVLVSAGEKKDALRVFRNGLMFGENRSIRREMDKLGWRTPPLFPSLGREHLLNRLIGRVRKRFVG